MMNVHIRGKGSIKLSDRDFLAEGGEARIYVKAGIAYKIYTEPKNMIPDGKIQELSKINNPYVVTPLDVIVSNKNTPIGFTLSYISDASPVCALFSSSYRNRVGVQHSQIERLVKHISEVVQSVHSKNCIIVDGNELNWIFSDTEYDKGYIIDTNSFQTENYPATAIMPSIKDYHTNGFNRNTDWFAFGILACQLLIGIHPYKGRHTSFKGLEERMRNNVSVFNKDVAVPPSTRSFDHIPSEYMGWFQNIFEKGDRIPPPFVVGIAVIQAVPKNVIKTTVRFNIKLVKSYDADIIQVKSVYGSSIVITKKSFYVGNSRYDNVWGDLNYDLKMCDIAILPKSLKPVIINVTSGILTCLDTSGSIRCSSILCSKFFILNNSVVCCHSKGKLSLISISDMGGAVVLSNINSWDVMEHSSVMSNGFLYQNILGKTFLNIPYINKIDKASCAILKVQELDGYAFIDGKIESTVGVIICSKGGMLYKFVFKFNQDFTSYNLKVVDDVENNINFTVLKNKPMCILLGDNNEFELFSVNIDNDSRKLVSDPDMKDSVFITSNEHTVQFYKDDELYELSMR